MASTRETFVQFPKGKESLLKLYTFPFKYGKKSFTVNQAQKVQEYLVPIKKSLVSSAVLKTSILCYNLQFLAIKFAVSILGLTLEVYNFLLAQLAWYLQMIKLEVIKLVQ